jgi:hypothetical protein
MICQPRRSRCVICGRLSSRAVVIDDVAAPLCDRCPSPQEVYERAAALRDAWPQWRRRQARADERHGPPVDFERVLHLGSVD